MNFEQQVQQWTAIDNQLKRMNEQTKLLREKRATLSKSILQQTPTSTVKISDGILRFVNTRVPEPLTFKYLEKSLAGIINNEQHVKRIVEHVKKHREIHIVPEIKRS